MTVPIGFGVAVGSIVVGLILVASVEAFVPEVEPTATPARIAYAAPLSGECTACHTDEEELKESGASGEEAERLYIEVSLTESTHGRLGCVTCHEGTPDTEDIELAHTGLVEDASVYFEEDCLVCHLDLMDEYEESGLLAPHYQVMEGLAEDLTCSDCHGSVGHGYDAVTGEVIISMEACMDCHEERELPVECEVCHTEMAAWSPETDCALCHQEPEVESLEDTNLLAYAHAQEGLVCGDCHSDLEALQEVHEAAVPRAPVEDLTVEMSFCFDCHVPNEHTSYEQIIELTADYIIGEKNINPHDPHAGLDEPEIECRVCHQMHNESTLTTGCYSCHHAGTLESCSVCH
jgi:nitrate/TMAO reductase-like tetraheme cytochrome c subunit